MDSGAKEIDAERTAMYFQVALDSKILREKEDAKFADPDERQERYLRQFKYPASSILSRPNVSAHLKSLGERDPLTLAKIELELQPEHILKDCLTLPDLQECQVLSEEMPLLYPEWDLPPLDFEMVLDRDPFSGQPGQWREVLGLGS